MKNLFSVTGDGIAVVELSQGKNTLVDIDDLPIIASHKWCFVAGGYAFTSVRDQNGKRGKMYLHRLLLGLTDPATHADHKNGDRLDNRRSNLRPATRAQNMQNQGLSARNNSRYKGVSYYTRDGNYRAEITVDGKRQHLGYYPDAESAARAYDAVATELHGSFAPINLLTDGD